MSSNPSVDDLRVRMATGDDVGALARLRLEWTNERSPVDRTAEATFEVDFAAWFAREQLRRVFWIATRPDRPIGMVHLVLFERMPTPGRSSDGWAHLSNMFVTADERNTGVGARLLGLLLDHADGLGLERVVLNPTERSVPFYTRHGFGPADDDLMMRRPSAKRM